MSPGLAKVFTTIELGRKSMLRLLLRLLHRASQLQHAEASASPSRGCIGKDQHGESMRGDGAGVYTGEQAGTVATQILTNTLPNSVANDIKSFLASSARGGGGRRGTHISLDFHFVADFFVYSL